jgi:hypothetical protein
VEERQQRFHGTPDLRLAQRLHRGEPDLWAHAAGHDVHVGVSGGTGSYICAWSFGDGTCSIDVNVG